MAEGNGLLNRRRGKTSTEGSNPSLSATAVNRYEIRNKQASCSTSGTGRSDYIASMSALEMEWEERPT